MLIIERYIGKQVMMATALVLVVLVGLDAFMVFFAEMSDLGKNEYNIVTALMYVLMHLPFDLYQLFPMAGFLGCLIGLGRLATQSELIVIRANGMSIMQITLSVIKSAILMLIIITSLGELVAPPLQLYSEHMKAVALGKSKNYSSLGGIWLHDQSQFIHVGDILTANEARDISVFEVRDHQLLAAYYATKATRTDHNQWILTHVKQTLFTRNHIESHPLEKMPVTIILDPLVLSLGNKSVDQLSLKGLYKSIVYRHTAGLYAQQHEFAFWQRMFQPFATIVMICLGIPFIFGSLRSASMGLRILIGISIGFIFYILNQFLGPLAIVYQLSPIIAALIPAVIFIIVCMILFRRMH